MKVIEEARTLFKQGQTNKALRSLEAIAKGNYSNDIVIDARVAQAVIASTFNRFVPIQFGCNNAIEAVQDFVDDAQDPRITALQITKQFYSHLAPKNIMIRWAFSHKLPFETLKRWLDEIRYLANKPAIKDNIFLQEHVAQLEENITDYRITNYGGRLS